MFAKLGPITKCLVGCMVALAGSRPNLARAQFVPGHIFLPEPSFNFCESDDDGIPLDEEYVLEIDPETATSRVFATIPRELCGGIGSMAMSPDGKRLRVSSFLQNVVWEFDAQGNRSVALDSSDGVWGPGGCNGSAYDRQGNFYISSVLTDEVLMFPANGRRAIVLADSSDGVYLPNEVAPAPNGDIYFISGSSSQDVFRISAAGEVALFDTFDILTTLVVDDLNNVYVSNYSTYRYVGGQPASGVLFLECGAGGLCVRTLVLSADRKTLYASTESPPTVSSIDPDASFKKVADMPDGASACGLAVIPLRADLDGDGNKNLADLELLTFCMEGPSSGILGGDCDLADMDADGDVDLYDVRFFLWAHSALQSSNEALMSLEARYL